MMETPPDADADGGHLRRLPGPWREVYKSIGARRGPGRLPFLITGESGTGKELVARRPFTSTARDPKKPFPRAQLRRHPGESSRKARFVRARERLVHRRRSSPHRKVSSSATVGRFCWMKSVICRLPCRRRSCVCFRSRAFERVGGTGKQYATDVRIIAFHSSRFEKRMQLRKSSGPTCNYRLSVFTIQLPPLLRAAERTYRLLIRHYLRRFQPRIGARSHRH